MKKLLLEYLEEKLKGTFDEGSLEIAIINNDGHLTNITYNYKCFGYDNQDRCIISVWDLLIFINDKN